MDNITESTEQYFPVVLFINLYKEAVTFASVVKIVNDSSFILNFSANDDPHGIFKLQSGAQKVQVIGSTRLLLFTVQRDQGTFGAVDIQYEVRHSEWYPSEMKGSVRVPSNKSQVCIMFFVRSRYPWYCTNNLAYSFPIDPLVRKFVVFTFF